MSSAVIFIGIKNMCIILYLTIYNCMLINYFLLVFNLLNSYKLISTQEVQFVTLFDMCKKIENDKTKKLI